MDTETEPTDRRTVPAPTALRGSRWDWLGAVAALAMAVGLGAMWGGGRGVAAVGGGQTASVDSVLNLIMRQSVDTGARMDSLRLKAVAHALDALDDPYATVFTPSSYKNFQIATGQQFGGLGVQLIKRHGAVVIGSPLAGSPAARAGLKAGDEIVMVDTVHLARLSFDAAATTMRGVAGSAVTITVRRPGTTALVPVRLVRQSIHLPSVGATALYPDSVGYVSLDQVGEGAASELQGAVSGLVAHGARSLILDLRRNPGGFVEEGVQLAGLFLPSGRQVASLRARGGATTENLRTGAAPDFPTIPLIVLVGSGTASAAEILAGALQDHDRALVVGSPTYGKGSAQSIFALGGGAELKLTTALWYTPSGRGLERLHSHADAAEADAVLSDSAIRVKTDSVLQSLEHPRPGDRHQFHTDAGRAIPGGPGIWPDTVVADAVFLERLRARRALGARFPVVDDSLFSCAILAGRMPGVKTTASAVAQSCAGAALALAPDSSRTMDARHWAEREAAAQWGVARGGAPNAVDPKGEDDAQIVAARALLRGARSTTTLLGRLSAGHIGS